MMMPERIGGPKPEEKKPALTVVAEIGKKMPSRIGGPREEEEEPEFTMSDEQAGDSAIDELFAALDARNCGPSSCCGGEDDPMRKKIADDVKRTVRNRAKEALRALFHSFGSKQEDSTKEQPNGAEE